MKLIGKMDDMLVYEIERGKYIIVDPYSERCRVEWTWYGQLGRYCDRFIKCGEDKEDEKCVDIIKKNQESVLKALNRLEGVDDDIGKEYLKEQDEFYDKLEEGREFDWSDGDYVEE